MKENSEQPAHPFKPNRPWDNQSDSGFPGITKREYFAGLAMQACIHLWNTDHKERLVKESIEIADELLKQLSK